MNTITATYTKNRTDPVETEPGIVDQDALVAPAHDPNGRCQSFCKRFSPERWIELQPPPNSPAVLVEFGQTVFVATVATAAAGLCGPGAPVCYVAAGAVAGAGAEILSGEAIDCLQDRCGDFSFAEAGADAFEGSIVGGTAGWLAPRTAVAAGSERATTGLFGLGVRTLTGTRSASATAQVLRTAVVETAGERSIVFLIRTAAGAIQTVVVGASDAG